MTGGTARVTVTRTEQVGLDLVLDDGHAAGLGVVAGGAGLGEVDAHAATGAGDHPRPGVGGVHVCGFRLPPRP
jgi:hypothetical protein